MQDVTSISDAVGVEIVRAAQFNIIDIMIIVGVASVAYFLYRFFRKRSERIQTQSGAKENDIEKLIYERIKED